MATTTKKKKGSKGIVLIKKANNLIESRYKFDIWETRFFLSVLAQIRKDDQDFQVYRIWYKDVIKTFGLKSGDSYAYLRSAAQSLMGKSFFVNYEENGIEREKQYHILREIDYLREGQEGKSVENHEYIDVTVEQKMRPLLLQLQKNFTAYDLRNIVKLGVYPVRVYELLKQYESIGKRTLKVDEMKRMFEVTEQYKLFGDFFRWVVKPAVKEVNKHTDLTISNVEKLKEGRRVTALRFTFHSKKEDELRKVRGEALPNSILEIPKRTVLPVEDELGETEADVLFNKFEEVVVRSFGVTPSAFLKLLNAGNYSESQIEQAVAVTRRAKYNQEIKKSVSGFFLSALKDGYTDAKQEAKKAQLRKEQNQQKIQILQNELQALENNRARAVNDQIRFLITEKPDIRQKSIEKIRENSFYEAYISKREMILGRPLTMDDFREDEKLRGLVIEYIVQLERSEFTEILKAFDPKILNIKAKIKKLLV